MEEKDKCVLCNKETEYTPDIPIEEREFYVEGCGQLCAECYQEVKTAEQADKKLRLL